MFGGHIFRQCRPRLPPLRIAVVSISSEFDRVLDLLDCEIIRSAKRLRTRSPRAFIRSRGEWGKQPVEIGFRCEYDQTSHREERLCRCGLSFKYNSPVQRRPGDRFWMRARTKA